jgi:hypothetical protein
MGKHACQKAGRCALSLLDGMAAREATAPATVTWAAFPPVCVGIGLVSSLVDEFYQGMKIFHDSDHFINQRVPASLRQFQSPVSVNAPSYG